VIHVVIPYVVTIDSLAVTVVDNVDAIDQLKPKILVASVIFSMAEYILFACSLWNLVTGVVIKPVVKILKIAALLIILLSVLSSSVVHDITSTLGVASLLPYHDSYKKIKMQYLCLRASFMMARSFDCQFFKKVIHFRNCHPCCYHSSRQTSYCISQIFVLGMPTFQIFCLVWCCCILRSAKWWINVGGRSQTTI
jgi:hypothetical protein